MACKSIIVLVVLCGIVAAVKQEPRHPPHQHGHNYHDTASVQPGAEPTNIIVALVTAQEEIVEDHNESEGSENEDTMVTENERKEILKARQEKSDNEEEDDETELDKKAAWVDCVFDPSARYSCLDCRTRIVCKYPGGGKLVGCYHALRPYCNNGICSAVPSSGCE